MRSGLRGRPKKVYQLANQVDILEEFVYITETPIQCAIREPHTDKWNNAIASDLKSIIDNDTWEVVRRPEKNKVIGSRLVLRNKYNQER